MEHPVKIHFISLSGVCTSDLAIALKKAGNTVSGSDEEINADVAAHLQSLGILNDKSGWDANKIHSDLKAVVVGPTVKADNPELKRAQELNLPLYSFPDFIYQQAIDKQRIVVSGSYGKAAIILIIMHVLGFHKRKFDYVIIGNASDKPESNVHLSNAPLIIIEGQDIMASVIDQQPAFLKYHHHIGLISGIEWQKSDSFPTKEEYSQQFGLFGKATPKGGVLIYFELDPVVAALSGIDQPDVVRVPYKTHASDNDGSHEFLITSEKKRVPLKITGKHNLQSISAAKEVLKKIGITSEMFYTAITSFDGN